MLDEIVEAAAGLPDGDEKVAPGDGVVPECPCSTLHMPFSKLIGKAKYRSTTTTRNLRTLRKVV